MQFKGTPQFPPGILDRMISREGGYWNAMTHIDWTTYFETMPADKIDLAYRLEADRMKNSSFEPKEVASERTVIISEREGNENEPLFQLGEAVQSAAFQKHPYHHEVIGEMKDLRSMTRDDLYGHYKKYYHPGNAIVAIAGDFDVNQLLPYLTDLFGSIPPQPTVMDVIEPEPALDGEKRVEVKGTGETTFIQVAYRSPNATHKDFFPLLVLDTLLTGPTSLNILGGGGISNKTSRLYQRLVEKEFTIGVHGSLQATLDPFMYDITLTLNPKRKPDEVLNVLDQELESVLAGSVTREEIDRAIKQTKALFVYSAENITNQAFWMGYAEIFANYDWFLSYMDRVAAVTPADILRVAETYLCSDNRIVGVYLPSTRKTRKSK
jgi:zinc protease